MKIAILGTGTIGRAIARSCIAKYSSEISIFAWDKDESALTQLPDEVVVMAPEEWTEAENWPDAIIIAVKPQDIKDAVRQFRPFVEGADFSPLWISVAAGIPLEALAEYIHLQARICRTMPNMALTVGESITAFSLNDKCNVSDRAIVQNIFCSCGKVIEVPEKYMNAITGLSGSGLAYVYLFLEALTEGGVSAGLPYAIAKECAEQTLKGASKMVEHNHSATFAQLKTQIMSPAGTTVRGLMALEENKFKYGVIRAVVEAASRAEELGKK